MARAIEVPGKRTKAFASQKAAAKRRRVVDAGSLPWKSVTLPEMFDDAEGFYSLEEVTGVEVVRNGDAVKFVSTLDNPDDIDEDEFEGFEDDPLEAKCLDENVDSVLDPEAEARPQNKTTNHIVKKKETGKKKIQDLHKFQTYQDRELESNVFVSAGEAAMDDAVKEVDMSAWAPLGLSSPMISSLARLKLVKPTDIQREAIPQILDGHDVVGKASTGSGKTLAFAIPIVEAWLLQQEERSGDDRCPIGLIMSPTRELAHQLTNHIKALCEGLPSPPFVCSVTGGLSVHKQQRQLEKANIVIGTPGRLWEIMSSSSALLASFKRISFLVLDEADRLLTEGQFKEAEDIIKAIDRIEVDEDDEESELFPRQSLIFSATFNKGLQQKLAGKGHLVFMNPELSIDHLVKKLNFREEKPKFIDVSPVSQMARGLKEGLVECGAMEKDLYLYCLLLLQSKKRTLVFTNSISAVRRLVPMLQNLNLPAYALHSQMPQKARLGSVERFASAKPGTDSVLVATDVAARGLDIPGIDVVIHYHVPRAADAYVHRSGRTARAGTSGISILLCAPEEVVPTRRLIAKVHVSAKPDSGFKQKSDYFIRTIGMDRRLVNRLKGRLTLAKKIADTQLAKEKGSKEDEWIKNAADELGVDYDSEDMEQVGRWGGRGSGRKSKQQEVRGLSKSEVTVMRAQLKQLLSKRINAGVSEKYIATGHVDVDELLKGTKGDFFGKVDSLDLDD